MTAVVLRNCRVFDGKSAETKENQVVVVEDGRIKDISERLPKLTGAIDIDLGHRTLMPGLIDAHVHVYSHELDMEKVGESRELSAIHAKIFMEAALQRGFTTLRDAAGADWHVAEALRLGYIRGPRLFYSGRALSQTGGHGDMRAPRPEEPCACGRAHQFAVVADGVDAVRAAAREELRCGANQLKIMASGGTASPSDPIWMLQYSDAEIAVAVEEAARRRTYVMAHAYSAEAIHRCVQLGVRSIEHGNMIDAKTARFMVQKNAYLVPTLITYRTLEELGGKLGFPRVSLDKIKQVRSAGLSSLELCREAGVKMGFGTDLLGSLHTHQCEEFRIRAEVLPPLDILRSATSINAELLNMSGELGVVAVGALADLIVVEGDPLSDLDRFTEQGEHVKLVMKGGEIFKNRLH